MPDDSPTRVILPVDEPSGGWRWPTRDRDHDQSGRDRQYDNSTNALRKTLDGLRKL